MKISQSGKIVDQIGWPIPLVIEFRTVKISKSRKGVVWWRTRDSLSHVSQSSQTAKPRSCSNLPAFLDFNGILTRIRLIIELKFLNLIKFPNMALGTRPTVARACLPPPGWHPAEGTR